MREHDDPRLTAGTPSRLLPVVAALVALAVGVAVGYQLRAGTEPSVAASAPETSVPPPPTAPPPQDPPGPCVEVAQRGTDLIAQLELAARAIGALDPGALRAVLDEVQQLRDQLQRGVDACRAQTGGSSDIPVPLTEPVAPSTPR